MATQNGWKRPCASLHAYRFHVQSSPVSQGNSWHTYLFTPHPHPHPHHHMLRFLWARCRSVHTLSWKSPGPGGCTLRTPWSWQKYCLNHCARTCCCLRIVTRCRFTNWRIRCERGGRNVPFLSIHLISFRQWRGIVLVMACPAQETDAAGRQWNAEKDPRNVRDFSVKRLPRGGTRSCMPQQTRYAGVCVDWEREQNLCVFWSRPNPHLDRSRHCHWASSLVQHLWLARFV